MPMLEPGTVAQGEITLLILISPTNPSSLQGELDAQPDYVDSAAADMLASLHGRVLAHTAH